MLIPNRPSLLRLALTTLAVLGLAASVVAQEAAAPAPAAQPKASPSPEQPKRPARPGDVQRVFVLQNAEPERLARVLSVFPATITSAESRTNRVSALGISAAPAVVAAIEETIKRLDVPEAPARSVEITVYVIEALAAPVADATVPAVLDPIVAQLKTTFRYASYRLTDTLVTRAVLDGGTRFQTAAISEGDIWQGRKVRYELEARPALITTDAQPLIRMREMKFHVSIPVVRDQGTEMLRSSIAANIDIRDGHYVVVGKSGTGQPGNALILVLRAKIVD